MHAPFILAVLMGFFSCSSLIAQTQKDTQQNAPVAEQLTPDLTGSMSSPENLFLTITNSLPQEATPSSTPAPEPQQPKPEQKKPEFEVYGFAMLDMGYDTGQTDPAWFDVERPTKLPALRDEFGHNGNFYAGVRQSRFGVKSKVPTSLGDLKTVFEFELFGVGVDAGQTTFRLRHAYGEVGQFLAGQTWSPFMDPDVFPNSIEYWGPNGMVFFRNVQLRWQPVHNENHQVMFALERPGASADLGAVADRDILQGPKFRFPAPDLY